MLERKKARVSNIIKSGELIQEVLLEIDHICKRAINYPKLTGYIKEGDKVLVNTTACSLNLGTGGYHYIISNYSQGDSDIEGLGHGMKLKYTPNQLRVFFSEEQDSPLHPEFQNKLSLLNKLVFVGELHSMIIPLCAYLKFITKDKIRVACIITDHGALPLWMSNNVSSLKARGLLDAVISIGNTFGGDYECVNIYTGLQLSASILNMDAIIITMGPGIMGTGTPFGFSGLELGFYIDLSYRLKARALYVPRISFSDSRSRHYGISHHYINTFREIIQNPLPIVLPKMNIKKTKYVLNQLEKSGLMKKCPIIVRKGRNISKALAHYKLQPRTMGRKFSDDPDFFYAQGAVVEYGYSQLFRE